MSEASAEFTVRDLNRRPAEVLAACDRVGHVRIRNRKGTAYELRPAPGAPEVHGAAQRTIAEAWSAHFERRQALRAKLGVDSMTPSQWEHLSRLIGGE